MTTTDTDAEAIARIISRAMLDNPTGGTSEERAQKRHAIAAEYASIIADDFASRREAQEPVAWQFRDAMDHWINTGPPDERALATYAGRFRPLYTAPPAQAGETIEEFRQALGDARDEASDSLRTLDAIAEFVGCPHDEELTVDHVRQHYMKLENAAQRQGILDAGRIANAEARAAGAPAGEVERLREALENIKSAILRADPEILTDTLWMPDDLSRGETVVDHIDAALNGGRADD